MRYSPSDCFETFPFPANTVDLEPFGDAYLKLRKSIMVSRSEGLTDIYNRFHNPADDNSDVVEFRRLQLEMNRAVASAYGCQDLDLSLHFHKTKQGIRYAVSEAVRRELLDRLLALNHQRHAEDEAEEVAINAAVLSKRSRVKSASPTSPGLFD